MSCNVVLLSSLYCSTMVSIADGVAAFPTASLPSSANAIAGNDDVLTEILVRTPVKSLIRFKCVSKHWSSLISGPHFSLLHTLRNPNSKLSGLLLRKTPSLHPTTSTDESDFEFLPLKGSLSRAPPFRSLDFIHDRPSGSGTKILQSCNGLFLCCSFPHTIGTTRNYYIVNPTTKQYIVLYPHRDAASTTVFGLNLAFDPSKSPHYKVVCVRSAVTSSCSYQIEIYSSESRCWRISGDSFKAPFDMVFTDGVFWNGAIHWISPNGASLRFDVDMDCLGTMPEIPVLRRDWDSRRYRFFGECSGHLHLIEIHGPQTTQFRVFEMERDYSKWFVKYSVNLDGIVAAFPEMGRKYLDPRDGHYYAFSMLCVLHEDDEDESLLVLNIPGKVISYNFKDNTLKELLDFAQGKIDRRHMLQFGCFDSYQYVETLAPV